MQNGLFRSLVIFALSLTATLLAGCQAMNQTKEQVAVRENGDSTLGAPRPVKSRADEDYPYALLSDAAYGNSEAGLTDKRNGRNGYFPDAAAGERGANRNAMVRPSPSGRICPTAQVSLKELGWRPWPGFPDKELADDLRSHHLRAEVWIKESTPASVVVAFGGTDPENRSDWLANFRWVLPARPDEYSDLVSIFAPAFVTEYAKRIADAHSSWAFLRSARLYATGHSLGGGLAQQFAYALPIHEAVPRVAQVYAFDPSPVTGFYQLPVHLTDINRKDLLVDRIYERGEALAIIRSIQTFVFVPTREDPAIRSIRYMLFYPDDLVSSHSMRTLACRIGDVATVK